MYESSSLIKITRGLQVAQSIEALSHSFTRPCMEFDSIDLFLFFFVHLDSLGLSGSFIASFTPILTPPSVYSGLSPWRVTLRLTA